jgi:hypothetical protein
MGTRRDALPPTEPQATAHDQGLLRPAAQVDNAQLLGGIARDFFERNTAW